MAKKPLDDPKSGIHRAKTWEIAFYSANNLSTNLYMFAFMYVTYFLTGFVGVGVVLAGSITTIMRMWDGVTDPFIGMIVDKTNGKFGKNRPFIIIGNVILAVFSGLIYFVIPALPDSVAVRFPAYIILYMLYIIGYTCQCCVTKSAQTCLTNDPEQRPVFSMFNMIFNAGLMAGFPIIVTDYLMPKYGTAEANFGDALGQIGFYRSLWLIVVLLSAFFAILAVIGLWRKDNNKYFGTGEVQKIGFRDYWDVLKNNRAIQMMIVATSTDKLAMSMVSNSTIMIMLYGIVCQNYTNYSRMSALITVPKIVLSLLLFNFVARKMGQKKAMVIGTWGGIVSCVGILLLFMVGDPTTLDLTFSNGLTFFTIVYFVLYLIWQSCVGVTGDLGITMTADCADYEVYRTGKYVPGLMGTLFSFVDKMVSSLAGTLVAIMLAAIGFSETLPTQDTPYSTSILVVTLFCLIGCPLIGYICNIVAMKFYPLTKEKMEEIQEKIADIKQKATAVKVTEE
ncbi:MAG: glucuronide permease [Subdoligranulum sp.]|nr:glucuronide permease [Subdoligranulum sp.]